MDCMGISLALYVAESHAVNTVYQYSRRSMAKFLLPSSTVDFEIRLKYLECASRNRRIISYRRNRFREVQSSPNGLRDIHEVCMKEKTRVSEANSTLKIKVGIRACHLYPSGKSLTDVSMALPTVTPSSGPSVDVCDPRN